MTKQYFAFVFTLGIIDLFHFLSELKFYQNDISSRGTKKSQLRIARRRKDSIARKSQKCAHTIAFFARNWLFFVRVKKLAFLRTARRFIDKNLLN